MPDDADTGRASHSMGRQFRILSVFADRDHRDTVSAACRVHAAGWQHVEAAAPTDAVLTLLSSKIDVVLVDLDWQGNLLGALVRHVRRSAPHGKLLGFGHNLAALRDKARAAGISDIHPWADLAAVLKVLLDPRQDLAADAKL